MTGKYAANVGLHTALIPGNPAGLDPKYTILPESLSKLGYKNCNYLIIWAATHHMNSCISNFRSLVICSSHQYLTNVQSWYRQFGRETIHSTQKFTSMDLLQMSCIVVFDLWGYGGC